MDPVRDQLVARARGLLARIEGIYRDVEYWNRAVRRPGQEEIDPDPDGTLASMARGLRTFLAQDLGVGPFVVPPELLAVLREEPPR